jgi:pyruvate kinase
VTTDLHALVDEVAALRDDLLGAEAARTMAIERVHPRHRASATNLVHYLELRRHDLRDLQRRLLLASVSALSRPEPHVLAAVDGLLGTLRRLAGQHPGPEAADRPPVPLGTGRALIDANASALLGRPPAGRDVRIMVTLPSEATNDAELVDRLVGRGMDLARVNCAHDDAASWLRMIHHVEQAAAAHGRPVRVAMDLAGPKLRTGPLEPGPQVQRIAPDRDEQGRVVRPALVWLTADDTPADPPEEATHTLPVVGGGWVRRRRRGDEIEVVDTRDARRRLSVVHADIGGCLAEQQETTYYESGLTLRCGDDATTVGDLPGLARALVLHAGDTLVLTRDLTPAPLPAPDQPARIGCTLPQAFVDTAAGDAVWFDDGKIGGVVEQVTANEITVQITHARIGGSKLKAEKGINLPDTDLQVPALTDKDLADIGFVADHAHIVNASFVNHADDVARLLSRLAELGAADTGIVLKIETLTAFENLPELLLTALQVERVGVMIARGDLAVEVGFERLAEVQEEILWLCEAAHVPVVWATQVLDTMARTGRPSRAEVTDAAMGERAECVMLNKGPYIAEAVTALADILARMNEHQDKRRPTLRRLRAWDRAR